MKLEDITLKLPVRKEGITAFFESCEKRKKFISVNSEEYSKHLKKAKHDLSRAINEYKDRCFDWTIIKAYYAIHHAANALLLRTKGIICKDHSCLIIALKHYEIISEEFFKEISQIHEALSDVLGLDLTFQLRKIGQYSVEEWEKLTDEDAQLVLTIAKKIVSFVEHDKTH